FPPLIGCREKLPAVALEEFEPAFDALDHRPRRNGGSGELIEVAAVLFDPPRLSGRIAQGAAVKSEYPVGLRRFDLIAQARRLGRRTHPSPETFALPVHSEH